VSDSTFWGLKYSWLGCYCYLGRVGGRALHGVPCAPDIKNRNTGNDETEMYSNTSTSARRLMQQWQGRLHNVSLVIHIPQIQTDSETNKHKRGK